MQTLSLLRQARQVKGLTLRQAAARAKLDPAHLSRIERGEALPSVEALARLAGVLELGELSKLRELLERYCGPLVPAD
jgi:transcriptional regulator with XRE-family HTH domain